MESYNADPTDQVNTDFIDWRERRYFGRNTTSALGLSLVRNDVPIDADGTVLLTLFREISGQSPVQVFQRTATHVSTGQYEVALSSADTGTVGNYFGIWSYALASSAESYTIYLAVGEPNPSYDQLPDSFQEVVDNVWFRFSDLFDSPSGGPHLQTYYQTHWSRGRMAQLMGASLRRLNVTAQPYTSFSIDGKTGAVFPLAQWGGLLELATYVEAIRHLQRSYLEQPTLSGSGNFSRLDRSEYWQRWGVLLADAEKELKSAQDTWKISLMMMGTPRVLVSGGVYGKFGPTRIAGSVAARPRYWTRFYS